MRATVMIGPVFVAIVSTAGFTHINSRVGEFQGHRVSICDRSNMPTATYAGDSNHQYGQQS
ncbi:hypothetical protein [Candidatus Filomicrobium marinum]|uniref:hypothetical protein n=1 Tax=Candidatus Filomicrobium marinum TaxID=1608628 RepID=UPI0012601254|nr:hypothetical protein [Candidatus Filomicrobium marinum]